MKGASEMKQNYKHLLFWQLHQNSRFFTHIVCRLLSAVQRFYSVQALKWKRGTVLNKVSHFKPMAAQKKAHTYFQRAFSSQKHYYTQPIEIKPLGQLMASIPK